MKFGSIFDRMFCLQDGEQGLESVRHRRASLDHLDIGRLRSARHNETSTVIQNTMKGQGGAYNRSDSATSASGNNTSSAYNRWMRKRYFVASSNVWKLTSQLGIRMDVEKPMTYHAIYFDDSKCSLFKKRMHNMEGSELMSLRWESAGPSRGMMYLEVKTYHRWLATETKKYPVSVAVAKALLQNPEDVTQGIPQHIMEKISSRNLIPRVHVEYNRTIFKQYDGDTLIASYRLDEEIQCSSQWNLDGMREGDVAMHQDSTFFLPYAVFSVHQVIDKQVNRWTDQIFKRRCLEINSDFSKYVIACGKLKVSGTADCRLSWLDRMWKAPPPEDGDDEENPAEDTTDETDPCDSIDSEKDSNGKRKRRKNGAWSRVMELLTGRNRDRVAHSRVGRRVENYRNSDLTDYGRRSIEFARPPSVAATGGRKKVYLQTPHRKGMGGASSVTSSMATGTARATPNAMSTQGPASSVRDVVAYYEEREESPELALHEFSLPSASGLSQHAQREPSSDGGARYALYAGLSASEMNLVQSTHSPKSQFAQRMNMAMTRMGYS